MSNDLPQKLTRTLENKRDEVAKSLPDRLDPDRFIKVALRAVTTDAKLQKCSRESLYLAVLEAGQLGLQPDGREGAIIPYGQHAEFQPMVQGLINLMLRSPGVQKVEARVVREGDRFEFNYGLNPTLDHRPKATGSEDRKLTHAYAICWRQGAEPTFEVMDREELERARQQSEAPNSPAWTQWTGEMYRKVVLKRLSKYVDLSPEATRAIETDHWMNGGGEAGETPVRGPSDAYASEVTRARTADRVERLREDMAEGDGGESVPEPSGNEDEPEPDQPQADGAPEGESQGEGDEELPTRDEAREDYVSAIRARVDTDHQVNTVRRAVRETMDGYPEDERQWHTADYVDAAGMIRRGGPELVADLLGEDPAQGEMGVDQ